MRTSMLLSALVALLPSLAVAEPPSDPPEAAAPPAAAVPQTPDPEKPPLAGQQQGAGEKKEPEKKTAVYIGPGIYTMVLLGKLVDQPGIDIAYMSGVRADLGVGTMTTGFFLRAGAEMLKPNANVGGSLLFGAGAFHYFTGKFLGMVALQGLYGGQGWLKGGAGERESEMMGVRPEVDLCLVAKDVFNFCAIVAGQYTRNYNIRQVDEAGTYRADGTVVEPPVTSRIPDQNSGGVALGAAFTAFF